MAGDNYNNILNVGFDWGTETSSVQLKRDQDVSNLNKCIFPTIVGYSKVRKRVHVGRDAIGKNFKILKPLERGFIGEYKAAREFAGFIRQKIDSDNGKEVRAIVAVPAYTEEERSSKKESRKRQAVRQSFHDFFEKSLMIPTPFLIAMGLGGVKSGDEQFGDPVKHSIIIDIGAGGMNFGLIQGFYPDPTHLINVPIGGQDIDQEIFDSIKRNWPRSRFSIQQAKKIKEKFSFVGKQTQEIKIQIQEANIIKEIDASEIIKKSCEMIIPHIVENVSNLISLVDPGLTNTYDAVQENIILTGGGSRIRKIDSMLVAKLKARGFKKSRIRVVKNYLQVTSFGALKTSLKVREDQWQF